MNLERGTRAIPLALVVDDDLSLRLSMEAALTKAGFNVITAENGLQGISLFRAEAPDIVLLDVIMPEMDGFETCRAIRTLSEGEHTQILMVTGLDDTASIEEAFTAGANDFVSKPINWSMLGYRARYLLRAGRAFMELSSSQRRLAKTQQLARLGNWEIDLKSGAFTCSAEACHLLGLSVPEGGITYDTFLSPIVDPDTFRIRAAIDKAIDRKENLVLNYRIVMPDGAQKHILNQAEVLYDSHGLPKLLLGVVQDVTRLKLAEAEIRQLAYYDGLTGLTNRMMFRERLNAAIESAIRKKETLAVLFLDLDRFKRVNDTLGHHIGDLLLKSVATTLRGCTRRSDAASRHSHTAPAPVLSRLGGDEFTILLPDIHFPENAAVVARRLLKEIPTPATLGGVEVSVTTSIGIAIYPTDGDTAEALMKNADAAMYEAKKEGRNNYHFYTESLNQKTVERLFLENELRKAQEKGELSLYYQPRVDIASGRTLAAEALIRWNHPEKGVVSPAKFIPIAEESGQILEINKWVLMTACAQAVKWPAPDGIPVRVSVNLSGYKLASQNIVSSIEEALSMAKMPPDRLEIEVTENVLMTEEAISTLQRIKDLGVSIALDDFGTGYSSLSYLATFPVDVIKIDRSFVSGSTSESDNRIIVKAIIAMGHSLGKRIVAEGIETLEQFELLKRCGCNEAQGYFFQRPLPQDNFVELLKEIPTSKKE